MSTDIDTILLRLKNAGFYNVELKGDTIFMEDPSCVIRSFENFFEFAWGVVVLLSLFLLMGWGFALIRGAKYDKTFSNLRNLTIIFCAMAMVKPLLTFIYGDDLFGSTCKKISVSVDEVMEISAQNKDKHGNELFETINIEDTGITDSNINQNNDSEDMTEMSDEQIVGAFENLIQTTEAYSREEQADVQRISNPVNTTNGATGGDNTVTEYQPPVVISDTEQPDNDLISLTPIQIQEDSSSEAVLVTTGVSVPVSAQRIGNAVIYTMADGSQVKRNGGTRAWRNLNPGNIRYGKFSQNAGAIGKDEKGFAIFPSESAGMRAIDSLLRTDTYYHLTIRDAISKYAPPFENDTVRYHQSLARHTGLSIDRKLSDLNNNEMTKVVNAIRTIEGWQPGTIVRVSKHEI